MIAARAAAPVLPAPAYAEATMTDARGDVVLRASATCRIAGLERREQR